MTHPENGQPTLPLRRSQDFGCRSNNRAQSHQAAMTQPMVSIECDKLSSRLASLSPPPLELVSLCSDDSDSLSSLSSDSSSESAASSPSSHQRRRAVFKSYWEKNGGAPLLLHGDSNISDDDDDDDDVNTLQDERSQNSSISQASESAVDANSYERTLKVQEGIERRRNTLDNSGRRRRIFGACPSCLTELPELRRPNLGYDYHNDVRLVKSNPELRRAPGPSCLRLSRYSGDKRSSLGRSTSSSVSFDSNVCILRYRETKENWAASGWSKYFAN